MAVDMDPHTLACCSGTTAAAGIAVGDVIRDLMNKAVPFLLSVVQSQLLNGVDLPKTVQDVLGKLDLRVWIQKGAEQLWQKIENSEPFKKVKELIFGRSLTDKIKVGDPQNIWVAQPKENGPVEILMDGKLLTSVLAGWKGVYGSDAKAVEKIDKVMELVKKYQQEASFQEAVSRMREVNAARKTPRTKSNPNPVQKALDRFKEKFDEATTKLRGLGEAIDKLILEVGINLKGTLKRATSVELRKNVEVVLGQPIPTGYSVHHLISVEVANRIKKFPVMEAAKLKGYNINNGNNLVALPNSEKTQLKDRKLGIDLPLHAGGHLKAYFSRVAKLLEALQNRYEQSGSSWNAEQLFKEIGLVEKQIRDELLDPKNTLQLNAEDTFKHV